MAASAAESSAPQGVLNSEALKLNDDVIDMLMLLDYEVQFCNKELKPMSRTFFVYPYANTAYQFRYFTQLVGWCFKLLKREPDWDEFDDPNTVITNITVMLKNMKIEVNAVPGKLKIGYGDSVCQLLFDLCSEVLRELNFEFSTPVYQDEGLAEEAEVDSDAEISVGEEDGLNDAEEDDLMWKEDEVKKPDGGESDDDKQVLEATVDPREWQLEVERVASKLKLQMPNDSKEWRTHLQQSKGYKQVIEGQFPGVRAQLEKLSKELSSAMERIRNKETFINEKFDERALDHRKQQDELQKVQSEYTELNQAVMDLQIKLKNVTEDLEQVKAEMEDRSTTVTDTAPIVKMKDSFKRLRADTKQLEVRIGVVSHTLMQAKLRQRPTETARLYGGGPGAENNDEYDDAE